MQLKPGKILKVFHFKDDLIIMVWIWIHDNIHPLSLKKDSNEMLQTPVDFYIDVNKTVAIFGSVKEILNESENNSFVIEGSVNMVYEGGMSSLPIFYRKYELKIPKIDKRIQNPEKIKERIDKWKMKEIQIIKRKNRDLVFKTLQIIDEIRNATEKQTAFDLSGILYSIDNGKEKLSIN
jgi:hypothetical protein